jgi:hypothetical protein
MAMDSTRFSHRTRRTRIIVQSDRIEFVELLQINDSWLTRNNEIMNRIIIRTLHDSVHITLLHKEESHT